jgi:DNA mismatch repair protein MutL
MASIHQLSPSVVNKIAAGEVIERPASIVKELMENSLDAGAMRVDVSVEQGGVDLVRVVDSGCGIAPGELHLAVASHATSKLQDAEDLFRVRTLGFRGEALASIAEVSRFNLRSRQAEHDSGAELEVVAGKSSEISPCGCPPGTTVEVRNLFFNTPVRRKFLRSTQTELGHVSEAFTRLALAHPHVHFTLRHNERQVHDLPPGGQWLERIARFFGQELAENLLWVESRDGDVRLTGYVAHPSQSRANNRMQYLFLNGRHIRDRSLQHALSEAYRGLLLTGRFPISFLSIEMPPDLVDVNVHPTKLEVRFQDGGRLYSQLLGTLRTKFLTSDMNHRLQPVASGGGESTAGETIAAAENPFDANSDAAAQARDELRNWANAQTSQWETARIATPTVDAPALAAERQSEFDMSEQVGTRRPLELNRLDRAAMLPVVPRPSGLPNGPSPGRTNWQGSAAWTADRSTAWTPAPPPPAGTTQPTAALQVHNRYLVTESEEGVVVIDQHALHERILYEQLRERALKGNLETQRLLVPEPVDLSGPEVAAVLEHQDLLAQLGLQVEAFGGDTVLVSSCPVMLSSTSPAEILRELIEPLVSGGKAPDRRDLLDELLHMMSCKAAIKAGDRLSPEEISALLEQRHLAQDAHHCPHGRPTALVFTREELDKQFKRT